MSRDKLSHWKPRPRIPNRYPPTGTPTAMSRCAVYTGSFDPITLGHLNVIERSSRLVDELIVGVGRNIDKQSMFSAEERVELIERTTSHLSNITVKMFAGLAVHFVRECDARVIIRGVRSLTDMETEFTMTLANRKLDPDVETVFLMADDEFSHVSSSLIKQITPLAGDKELSRFVPAAILGDLRAKLSPS
jgi:pantetheine-phosphate adenylyltransferase